MQVIYNIIPNKQVYKCFECVFVSNFRISYDIVLNHIIIIDN